MLDRQVLPQVALWLADANLPVPCNLHYSYNLYVGLSGVAAMWYGGSTMAVATGHYVHDHTTFFTVYYYTNLSISSMRIIVVHEFHYEMHTGDTFAVRTL